MFSKEIAMICGVNAAIIAQFIHDKIGSEEALKYGDKVWCRCSMITITIYFPFLTKHMVANAIKKLLDAKVIRKGCHNQNRFDHTNWYTFTEYGRRLMSNNDEGNKKRPNFAQESPKVVLDIDGPKTEKCLVCTYYDYVKRSCGVCVKDILDDAKEKYSI